MPKTPQSPALIARIVHPPKSLVATIDSLSDPDISVRELAQSSFGDHPDDDLTSSSVFEIYRHPKAA